MKAENYYIVHVVCWKCGKMERATLENSTTFVGYIHDTACLEVELNLRILGWTFDALGAKCAECEQKEREELKTKWRRNLKEQEELEEQGRERGGAT